MNEFEHFKKNFYESVKANDYIQGLLIKTRENIKSENPFLSNTDIRISFFNYILQHSRILVVNSNFFNQNLENFGLQDILLTERFLRFYYFINIFSSFENCLRVIMRNELHDEYYKNPDIVNFIKNHLKETDKNNVLQFSKTIRNCIHNNGFYFPDKKTKENIVIFYRHKEYQFKLGEPIYFLDWEMVFSITEDIIMFFNQILKSEYIPKNQIIKDPVSNYENLD